MTSHQNRWKHIVLLIWMACCVSNASAYFSYGARAIGMGGAYAGITNDASVFYWNPGGLMVLPGWIIETQYGSDAVFADDARDTIDSMKQWRDEGDAGADKLMRGMTRLAEKEWLFRGGDTLSFVIANQHMAFFFNQRQIYYLQHDKTGSNLETDPSGRDENGDWRYVLSGVDIREYGMTITMLGGKGNVALGVTGRYVDVNAYHSTPDFFLIESAETDQLMDLVESGTKKSAGEWAIDAGITMVFGTNRLGITARNLRKYDIEIESDLSIQIRPEYRIGYMYQPTDRFVFSMDYSIGKEFDLLGNRLEDSELAAGFEGVFGEKKWLILRSGVSMPLDGDAPMIFSLGTGLAFDAGMLDVGYAFDRDRDTKKLWAGLRFTF